MSADRDLAAAASGAGELPTGGAVGAGAARPAGGDVDPGPVTAVGGSPPAGAWDGRSALSGAGVVPRRPGGVATWLPEGRWAEPDEEHPAVEAEPPPRATRGRVSSERRRRGQRRVAAARLATRLAGWPRRVLAVALVLAAVAVALRPDPPPAAVGGAPPGVPVVVAGRDLAAGAVLTRPDLRTADLPSAAVPGGSAREPASLLGRTLAGPVRRGEVLTDARIVGPGLTAGLGSQDVAAVPVRLADAEAAALVRSGDRVDVLGAAVDADAATGSRDAVEVATAVRVLAVLRGDAADGVVVVLAATSAVARRLAGAASRYRLTVAVRPP